MNFPFQPLFFPVWIPIYGGLILKVETTYFATLHLEKLQFTEKAATDHRASNTVGPLPRTDSSLSTKFGETIQPWRLSEYQEAQSEHLREFSTCSVSVKPTYIRIPEMGLFTMHFEVSSNLYESEKKLKWHFKWKFHTIFSWLFGFFSSNSCLFQGLSTSVEEE